MNILYLTYYNLNETSAALNRAKCISGSLKKYNISTIVVGSGCSQNKWQYREINNQKQILFNRKCFASFRHSNSMRFIGEASKFYKKHLSELIDRFNISGVIIYSPFAEMVNPIIKISNQNKKFVIAELGEYYSLSVRYLLNGVIFQQFFFKYFQIKKLDGAIYGGEFWKRKLDQFCIPSIRIATIAEEKKIYRTLPSKKNKIIKILFLGRFSIREVPDVIFEALSICKQKGLNFSFQIIGTKNKTFEEKYWIRKLKKINILKNSYKIFGFVSDKLKNQLLKNADIFVMLRPSNKEVQQMFPFRIPEFLMSSNPLILTKIPSLKYYLRENQGVKFISSVNDANELASKIISLSKNPLTRYRIGLKGRKYAKKYFSQNIVGKKLSKFLFKYNLKVTKRKNLKFNKSIYF